MRYMVLTSDGAVHQTDSAAEYISWLDQHGPEVVDSHEPTDAEQARLVADEIDQLQARYDRLTRIRARWIARYDQAADGSRDKQVAREQLDEIGAQVSNVERKLDAAIG